ncbi:Hypothetical predicted protein [Cloeon dipterum]|uniref:GOLD domain-containing protein n=1 Tax=Cloeon dipterum TaxID=197152 RepID=A0A8S1CHI4_9INSE|nr:Hypothetical predicted protein [Cloeon dipterum]
MAPRCLLFFLFLVGLPCLISPQQQASTVDPQESTLPWYETLPAVAMDYKVHIDPGKEDCYYQYVNPGATFYVSFQVLRGGDGMAGFAVRHPNGQIIHPYQWKQNAEFQDQSSTGGYYAVCIDNQFSRFAAKLVNLYITVIRYDEWDKFSKEVEDMDLSVQNFTVNKNSLSFLHGILFLRTCMQTRNIIFKWNVVLNHYLCGVGSITLLINTNVTAGSNYHTLHTEC